MTAARSSGGRGFPGDVQGSLHDTVFFEIQGVPSVTIASSEFVDAATTQAQALGMLDAKRIFVDHPIQDATDDEMRAKAEAIFDQVITSLTETEATDE